MSNNNKTINQKLNDITDTLTHFKRTVEYYLHNLEQEITKSQLFIDTLTICKDHYSDQSIQNLLTNLLSGAKKLHEEFKTCQNKPQQYIKDLEQYQKKYESSNWYTTLQTQRHATDATTSATGAAIKLNQFERELNEFLMEMELNIETQNQSLQKLRQSYQKLDDQLFSLINPVSQTSSVSK